MCLFHRHQLDPKTRRIQAAGLCLFMSGLMLVFFEDSFGHRHPHIYNDLRLLLMGCAVCLIYWSARRSDGCASGS
jgi:drug/metabolite transporter (DMT)-like permease